jgi:MerR family transcriptional regulator, light-induced transcriptional regulator
MRDHVEASAAIERSREELAELTVDLHYAAVPELVHRYGNMGRLRCLEDARYHLSYLIHAISVESAVLFGNYARWLVDLLTARNIPLEDFRMNLVCLRNAISKTLPEIEPFTKEFFESATARLSDETDLPTHISDDNPNRSLLEEYLAAAIGFRRQRASKIILDAMTSGVDIRDIYVNVFQQAQYEIGRLWQINKLSVPQEHYCTAVTQQVMAQLYPYLFGSAAKPRKVVAACVQGELHEIGSRILVDFFEMSGWDTRYFGANTPTSGIVEAVRQEKPDLLLVSVTMTFHLKAVSDLIRAVRRTDHGDRVKILVGGYPFIVDPVLWHTVGADGSARDAKTTVLLAEQLLGNG